MDAAERLFSAQIELGLAEEPIGDALDPWPEWDDYTYDYYDRSIEVYCSSEPVDPDAMAAAMFGLGFSLVWVHPHVRDPKTAWLCPCKARRRPPRPDRVGRYSCVKCGPVNEGDVYGAEGGGHGHTGCWQRVTEAPAE